jgi:uncharacterized RDD family membrane protein YckC
LAASSKAVGCLDQLLQLSIARSQPLTDFMTARIETTRLIQADAEDRASGQSYLERFRAPFSLRCGAFLIDYILLAAIIAFSTMMARFGGGRPRALMSTAETLGLFIAGAITALNFVGLTALRGQTLGKWATGLRIRRKDGEDMSWQRSLMRHLIAYPLSFLILGLGFLVADFQTAAIVMAAIFFLTLMVGFIMALGTNGRALHDIIADTVVVREDVRRTRRLR